MVSFIKITDNYDRKGHKSFSDLMNDDESILRMIKMYDDLTNSDVVDYYEIDTQQLEILGEYAYSDQFLYDDNINVKNQKITYDNGENIYITPVKAIQLGEKTFEKLGVNQFIEDNVQMTEDDFIYKDNIPVILGCNYRDYCNIGDVIDGFFLTKNMNFVVKGFFCENTSIIFDNYAYDLNNVIFIPLINVEGNQAGRDNDFEVILYSIKNSGYLSYSSTDGYTIAIKELKQISEKNQLDYTFIPGNFLFDNNPYDLSNYLNIYSIFALVVFNLTIFIMLFSMVKDYCRAGCHDRVHRIRNMALAVLLFVCCIFAAYYFSVSYFRYSVFLSLFMQKIKIIMIGIVVNCFLALSVLYVLLIKK